MNGAVTKWKWHNKWVSWLVREDIQIQEIDNKILSKNKIKTTKVPCLEIASEVTPKVGKNVFIGSNEKYKYI